ncbi:hypothetical protein [Glycocaulis sp.]|uniref:hypothetical protein n=1 Tax=Glycocaulis sp. TaxID=1969725 RepID=UPI0025BA553E|nr:hypothetical protein [Glycocaulis sp.]MCH8521125.1 hypothetical protein [Glycocaulis sp.]
MSSRRRRGVYQAIAETTDPSASASLPHAERELYVATDFFYKRPELREGPPTKCHDNRPDIELIGHRKIGIEITEIFAEGNRHWSDADWGLEAFESVINAAVLEKAKKFDWGHRYTESWLLLHTSEYLLIPEIPGWINAIRISTHPFNRVFLNYMPLPNSLDIGAHEIGFKA